MRLDRTNTAIYVVYLAKSGRAQDSSRTSPSIRTREFLDSWTAANVATRPAGCIDYDIVSDESTNNCQAFRIPNRHRVTPIDRSPLDPPRSGGQALGAQPAVVAKAGHGCHGFHLCWWPWTEPRGLPWTRHALHDRFRDHGSARDGGRPGAGGAQPGYLTHDDVLCHSWLTDFLRRCELRMFRGQRTIAHMDACDRPHVVDWSVRATTTRSSPAARGTGTQSWLRHVCPRVAWRRNRVWRAGSRRSHTGSC